MRLTTTDLMEMAGAASRYGQPGAGSSMPVNADSSIQRCAEGEGQNCQHCGTGCSRAAVTIIDTLLRTKRTLVVSRNPQERSRLSEAVAGCGCEVLAAADGTDAVAWAKRTRVDVLVIDVKVGRIAGRHLLRLLGLPEDIKVILVADDPRTDPFWPGDPETPVVSKQASLEHFRNVVFSALLTHPCVETGRAWQQTAAC